MALVCSTSTVLYDEFEFLDCSTININYNQRGIASISFSVVSSTGRLDNDYTNLTFGGVNFQGTLDSVQVSTIPGTLVYIFQLNMTAFGC